MNSLSKITDEHAYIFKYEPGCEDQVIEQIMYQAGDHSSNLSWSDAAELCLNVANAGIIH